MSTPMKRTEHPNFETSYSLGFAPLPHTSPIVHYKNFPFLVDPQPESHQTSEANETPKGPHRLNTTSDIPPALGLGTSRCFTTFHRSENKPIVRAPWPKAIVSPVDNGKRASPSNDNTDGAPSDHAQGAPADDIIGDICRCSFYESTSRRAGKEYALPVPSVPKPTSTLEADADSARLRPKRCAARPGVWQHFATQWDRIQLREPPSAVERMTLPNITENRMIAQQRVKMAEERICSLKKQNEPVTEDMPQFNRAMPGYGGYVSRSPNKHKMMETDEQLQSGLCSTSRCSYRRIPPQEYVIGRYARKAPLSKTVTLTYPYNPFCKKQ